MANECENLSAAADTQGLVQALNRYRAPSSRRSLFELALTLGLFVVLWIATWLVFRQGWWLAWLALALPAGVFLLRLFIIQHDCGHGAFLKNRVANDWIGRAISILTVTPYDYWRRAHAIHHATCGDLGRRGVGDILTLTAEEYRALSAWGQFKYRVYRHPFTLLVIGPAFVFLLQQRLPVGFMKNGWRPWVSTQTTNVALVAAAALAIWLIGFKAFLAVHLPILLIAATIGVWLFYVQHQFERTIWIPNPTWSFHEAALHGSSFYDLPWGLRWLTGYIGVHHVHHLCSRIPFYRLPDVLRDYPQFRQVGRISMLDSLACLRLRLWDEASARMVSFRELKASRSIEQP